MFLKLLIFGAFSKLSIADEVQRVFHAEWENAPGFLNSGE